MLISGGVAGLVGMPAAARRQPRVRAGLPGRARLHRHRDRAARPQQPDRHRVRRAAVVVPGTVGPDPRPGGRAEGDRDDHAGRHGAVRRHRVRAGAPVPRSAQQQRRVGAELAAGRRAGQPARGAAGMTATGLVEPTTKAVDGGRDAAAAISVAASWLLRHRRACSCSSRSSGVVTGANDITSSGTIGAALRLAVPIGLAGLGGLWSERAGVVNIGLEGMMILGTWFGAWGALRVRAVVGRARRHHRRRARRSAPRRRHRHLRRRPHRLRCRDQHPRRRRHPVPGRADLRRHAGRRRHPVPAACPDRRGHAAGLGGAARPRATSTGSWSRTSPASSAACHPGLAADDHRGAAGAGHLLRAVADHVRPAAALLRREPGRGRVARRQRLPVQVHRGDPLRRRSPGSAARSSPWSRRTSTARARPAAAATSAWPR